MPGPWDGAPAEAALCTLLGISPDNAGSEANAVKLATWNKVAFRTKEEVVSALNSVACLARG